MDKSYQLEMFDKSIKILHELKNAGEIKDFLISQEIKGIRGNAAGCVISRYVKSNLPDDSEVTTNGSSVRLTTGFTEGSWVLNTAAMSNFINAFDQGMYPELIK